MSNRISQEALQQLVGSVAYDRMRSPFVGDGARFSLVFSQGGPVGIGPVHARAAQMTRYVATGLMQLWVKHDGRWRAIARQALRSHPAYAEEEAREMLGSSSFEVHARTVFDGIDTAYHEVTLGNVGDHSLALDVAWCGQVDPDTEISAKRLLRFGCDYPPRDPFADKAGSTLRIGYRGDASLPRPAIQIEADDPGLKPWKGSLPCWCEDTVESVGSSQTAHFAMRESAVRIAPGQRRTVRFRIRYVMPDIGEATQEWPEIGAAWPDISGLIVSAESVLVKGLGGEGEAVDSQLMRARWALRRCGYQGRDGQYANHRACLCTPGTTAFSIVFFWDALFSSAAISAFDADYARDALRVPLRQSAGRYVQRQWDHCLPHGEPVPQPQAPCASWALAHHLSMHDDEAFLAEMYPCIADLHRFWQTQDADGDGLPEWRFTGLNADNGPHYLQYMPPGVHNVYIPPIASVSLASFLHLDALLLADFAERLGRSEDIPVWRERAAFLAGRLHDICWHEEDGCFYDYDHHLGVHQRVRTHLIFWPLWAGVPMKADARERLLARLLNPRQFNGPIPFPTCAYDDPHYDAESYWSGRSWPHISYWLIELLAREGYGGEATAAADRWLAWQSGHAHHREAVTTNPHLSEHCERSDFSYRTGRDFDYNWAAAAVHLMAERRYEQFIPLTVSH